VTDLRETVTTGIADGRMGERLWLYATYHCNLACSYCLTESSPQIADRRALDREAMLDAVHRARELGLTCVGITGGETFMLPWLPEALVEIGRVMPTIVLTNATLFTDRMLERLEPLADSDVTLQISLDSDEPERNDEWRGPDNFAKVLAAIPKLLARGIHVRIATTVERQTDEELARLCTLHRSLGISDDDHIVRSVVRRGRAAVQGMGAELSPDDVLPELTVTADGAFLHPFAPTVRDGRTDIDLLVSRQTRPLDQAMSRFLQITAAMPSGADVVRNIR
jgi:MoaA/NifB/PqqE/SkfB family radical SAM enzyme